MKNNRYDVVIVGAGISGTALAYVLSRYTDIGKIAVLEKYDGIATLNSSGTSNSQTIHTGDIETNYTLAKAAVVRRTAKMVEKYCLRHGYQNDIIFSHRKMAMGVGDDEVRFLLHRYEEFSGLFPYLEVWDKEALRGLEPRVIYGADGRDRPERIVAVGARGQWTTVDFGRMAASLISNAVEEPGKTVEVRLKSCVRTIEHATEGYRVHTADAVYEADAVVVNAGAHSLYLAHRMGYGLELSCLPIAGSFYLSRTKLLNGKVYMIQNPKLPFAALHGDPDILADGRTRFGPTALPLPKLERYTSGTYGDFLTTLRWDGDVAGALWKLIKDRDIRHYMVRNLLLEVPYLNKRLFLNEARKIIPSLQLSDYDYARGFGGIRPQVIDKRRQQLILGEASINPGEGIVFNMTPSPGATNCLANAERDGRYVARCLGRTFFDDRFAAELTEENEAPAQHGPRPQTGNAIRDAIHAHDRDYYREMIHGEPSERFFDPIVDFPKNKTI